MERPQRWEVVCQTCFSGFIMSDEEAGQRLGRNSERMWPKHCGRSMSLRHIMKEIPKKDCSHAGCWYAQNATCGCSCYGMNHGVMNPNPSYSEVKIAVPAWYKIPIKTWIENPKSNASTTEGSAPPHIQ